ncbi:MULTISPECIES: LysR substrate-binding domain-containing protein [Herbaspirillum]|jgi:aminoethylphosphonate catabolism LysR family transcriptional regulator|uniref:LysR substrate-binding domain-containing protein n=1 Tax=Herbaspirillum TaxID=963 RepID=UPI000400CAC9|nr:MULTISPECIES: LysR substrate-binding domain-containing protein [Herbaspirillum]MAF01366.1 LysR family transcriptional regulator [Herbaspirillum sp.]MBO18781.1 LysR family transcriptional regulator [Herbaspirillum sp.]MCP3653997.1 LysR family transcriptional regulator [Herbaspirillum sp.]MCP3949071.1 LysR family transcriptional regulator [Herbaspirillum sp.]MCP4034823.1 LysR family transcriptional regulator [Herbaspirillum sp.]
MTPSQLRAFLAVARHRGFSAAARALGVSQPTLTTQVQSLEREHNVELFFRRGRRVDLSETAQRLLPIAQNIAELELDALNLLVNSGALHVGHLRIGAVGPFHVIEMVDAYRARYPKVELSIKLGNSAQSLADLANYVTDVAVLASFNDDARFHSVPYADHAVVLFAHRSHPFYQREAVSLAELDQQPLIMREQGSTTRLALEQALQQAGAQPQVVMEIGSREALREAVARGLGLGAVSEAEFIPDERFRMVRIAGDPVSTHTYVYCLAERREGRLVGSFMKIAQRA